MLMSTASARRLDAETDRSNTMTVSLRTSFAAFVLSSALAGAAVPALATSFYEGVDPHHPPGTQNRGPVLVPMTTGPYYVDPAPTGSIYVDPMPTGSIYVDPVPMRRVYVDPVPTGSISPAPGRVREHYMNEYHGGGQGDFYQGITPPAPRP
jgi:hypothetical protein